MLTRIFMILYLFCQLWCELLEFQMSFPFGTQSICPVTIPTALQIAMDGMPAETQAPIIWVPYACSHPYQPSPLKLDAMEEKSMLAQITP